MIQTTRRFIGYNILLLAFGALALLIMVVTSVVYSQRTQDYAADALRAARLDAGTLAEAVPPRHPLA